MPHYAERAELTDNPTAKKLFKLMDRKQTNLALSADIPHKEKLISLIDKVGPQICVLKTHIDIVEDFDIDLIKQMQRLAEQHDFLIFEDRKFADIGNTVKHQYADGIYHIAEWAPITNAHIIPGPGIIEGLKSVGLKKGNGLLLLAEMSSAGSLATNSYTQAALDMALTHPDFVIGFIAQHRLTDNPAFITMTPGVKLAEGTDSLGQQYLTPKTVIKERHSDVIIVGRGIYAAENPAAEAKKYRKAGWEAYIHREK